MRSASSAEARDDARYREHSESIRPHTELSPPVATLRRTRPFGNRDRISVYAPAAVSTESTPPKVPFYRSLYAQVLVAIAIGVLFGALDPTHAKLMKPLGDAFIKLVKMLIGPLVFLTVTLGIAGMRDMKQLGRVGVKAVVYFEVVSTLALAIGLVVVNVLKPGVGFHRPPSEHDVEAATRAAESHAPGALDFLMNIIPSTPFDAFSKGELLGILFFAVLFGFGVSLAGEVARPTVALLESLSQVVFRMIALVMKLAPIGAFGAMAFTVGNYGLGSLANLAQLMGSFYLTCVLFIVVVLGSIARVCGFSILRFVAYIKEELLIVLGTSSSESALPRLMLRLEELGCPKPVVGLVVPTGYSFNLDGTNIYMTMAAIFIAQATHTPLTIEQQLTILGVAMLTSKGAAGVTGSGLITLAATIQVQPSIPIAGLALIVGIDRFMSEARALTNFIGNGVATMAVSRWEGVLDLERTREVLAPRS